MSAREERDPLLSYVTESAEELLADVGRHFRPTEWVGGPFSQPTPDDLRPTRELLESPNYYEVIPTGAPYRREDSLYLTIDQKWFDRILSGEKTVEYRQIKDTTARRYLDLRVSSDGPMILSSYLPEDFELGLEVYNEGIFPFLPRYYEYVRLEVGRRKDRDIAVLRLLGVCFVPEPYREGKVWRADLSDTSITEEQYEEALRRDPEALKELLYRPDGPDTYWTMALVLGDVVESNMEGTL